MTLHERISALECIPRNEKSAGHRRALEELRYSRHVALIHQVFPLDVTSFATETESRYLSSHQPEEARPISPEIDFSVGALLWARLVAQFVNESIPEIERVHREEIGRIPTDALERFLGRGELPSETHSLWRVPYYIWGLYCGCLTYPCDIPAAVTEDEAIAVSQRLIEIETHTLP